MSSRDPITYSRVTDQGTAMSEATLCAAHYCEPFIGYANVIADGAGDVGGPDWVDSTGNDAVSCVECNIESGRYA